MPFPHVGCVSAKLLKQLRDNRGTSYYQILVVSPKVLSGGADECEADETAARQVLRGIRLILSYQVARHKPECAAAARARSAPSW